MSRKPSYFDDNYEQKAVKKRKFTLKSVLQVTALLVLMGFKKIRDTVVSRKSKHSYVGVASEGSEVSEKKLRRRKRRITFLLFVFMILYFVAMIFGFMVSVNNENKRIKQFNADAGQVCSEYIIKYGATNYENLYPINGIVGYRMTGLSYVRELDFDNDSKSELLACYNDNGTYVVEIWGYSGDEFVSLYLGEAAKGPKKDSDIWITLYRTGNEYMIGEHNDKDETQVTLRRLRGDKFETYDSECTYNPEDKSFTIDDEVDYTSFERIRLAVLIEEKASVTAENVSDVIDGFISTDAAKIEEDNNSKTLEGAYAKVVREYVDKLGEPNFGVDSGSVNIGGLAIAKRIDFNDDGVDELLLVYRKTTKVKDVDSSGNYVSNVGFKYVTEVYAYIDKQAKLVLTEETISEKKDDNGDKYIVIQKGSKRNNLCVNNFSSKEYGHVESGTSIIYKFDGTTFFKNFKARYVNDYGYTEYFINDDKVYRSEFNEKGYTVPFFDGEDSYSKSKFDVYYVQRSMNKKPEIEDQISETKDDIEKILAK